jgi:anthranilate synthase component 2
MTDFRFETKRAKGVVLKASSGVLELNSRQPISARKSNDPIVVIDNYDSFTYNLCQVFFLYLCNFCLVLVIYLFDLI